MKDSIEGTILLAEDDPSLGTLLAEFLESRGFKTILTRNGEEALEAWASNKFTLCILDVMMPRKDGFAVAKEIRKKDQGTPLIFLTARTMHEDAMEGFRSGADDYIAKPFNMDELVARIQAILRRVKGSTPDPEEEVALGSYTFHPLKSVLIINGQEKKLTSKESALLTMLSRNKNQVLDRNEALREVWGDDSYFTSRSMDVYITRLRKYLKEDPRVEINNIHGRGFRLLVSEG